MTALRSTAKIALRNLAQRKGRAALMMIGVAVGLVTLVLVTGVTRGTQREVQRKIRAFGPDAIMIKAGSPTTHGPGDARVTTLLPRDLEAVRTSVEGIRVIAPVVARPTETFIAGDHNSTGVLFGVRPEFEEAWDWHVASGAFFTQAQEASHARVTVLGQTMAHTLFGEEDPVGQSVRIAGQRFEVVGISAIRGTSPIGSDMDNISLVPLSTAMRRLYNVDHYSMIRARFFDNVNIQQAAGNITELMRRQHSIQQGDTDDFALISPATFHRKAAKMSGTLTLLLWIITFVALGAGALVLANILTIAVAERRVEIGVRRAVGATQRQIIMQFLVEGVVVTVLGGVLGIALGVGMVGLLQVSTALPVVLGWEPFVLGPIVTLVAGLLASIIPARRAAATDIANALRP